MSSRFRKLSEIYRAEEGVLLVFFGISLTVLLGMVALSFDLGRIDATQTELQSYADSVALAAAGELDGKSDSITRATAAANNLISDTQTFGNGNTTLSGGGDFTLLFLETLPASDLTNLAGPNASPQDARYVRVAVNAQTVDLTFAAAFFALRGGGTANNTVNAFATAGYTQFACDIAPLMFCVPQGVGYTATSATGHMIQLRSGGSGQGAWGPGDFGFLDPSKAKVDPNGPCATASGGNLDRCLIGATGGVTQCFSLNGVDIEPGQKVGSYEAAINTRFDVYLATMNGRRNDAAYAPAPNVVKGIVTNGGQQCIRNNSPAASTSMALPRDNCFAGGTCAHGGRFGNGTWDRTTYINTNHAGSDPVVTSGATLPGALSGSRWEMYLAEIAAAGGGDILTGLDQTGLPTCNTNGGTTPDRRVVIAAGIDCVSNSIGGAASNVPVQEFYKIFLTEQAAGTPGNNFDIWGEVIGSAGGAGAGGAGAVIHDVVQLYR